MAAASAEWYYIPPGSSNKPFGPLTYTALAELVKHGTVPQDAFVWHAGLPEWRPWNSALQETPLVEQLRQSEQARPAPSMQTAPAKAIVASTAKPADPEDALASFMGEISAIEEEAAAKTSAERTQSPAPDEREFVDDDGTTYRWDSEQRLFKPVEASAQAVDYSVEEMVYQPDEERIPTIKQAKAAEAADADPLTGQKRQRAEAIAAQKEKIAKAAQEAKEKKKKEETWFELKKNTNVYVTGLPGDVTVEEMASAFGKCGIIKENEDRAPRIKLYKDEASGMLKGDGLVTFLKEPSVEIACTILDGAPLRPGGPPMSVTVAQFAQKTSRPAMKKKPQNKKQKKNMVVSQEKRLDWNGFDDVKKAEDVTVILKHMFTLEELQAEPTLAGELKEDVAAECAKLGPIERLKLFQGNPEGVISIRFKMEEAAAACIQVMNGRYFGGRQVAAHKYDGKTNYNIRVQETPEQQAARLEAYTRELEASGGAD
eukprot:jgi/Tetstr1/458368/TSEL_044807.t1